MRYLSSANLMLNYLVFIPTLAQVNGWVMYLNCKTNYSFRYGTFFTQELVRSATEFGTKTLALTNINNTCDAWDFVLHCQKQTIKPILGTEIRNGDKLLRSEEHTSELQ